MPYNNLSGFGFPGFLGEGISLIFVVWFFFVFVFKILLFVSVYLSIWGYVQVSTEVPGGEFPWSWSDT